MYAKKGTTSYWMNLPDMKYKAPEESSTKEKASTVIACLGTQQSTKELTLTEDLLWNWTLKI